MLTLFLDFDGVLNSATSGFIGLHLEKTQSFANPDIESVKLIDYFVELTNAQIVVSSSWRKLHTFDELKTVLRDEFGFKSYNRVIDITDSSGKLRGEEIQRYIEQHNITDYIIFDDDSDMLESQMEYFVKTNGYYGFSVFDLEQACKIANVEMM